ncbi:unnamed protein product [Prunus brigantina]
MSMSRDAGLRLTTRFAAAVAVVIFSLIAVARCSNNDSEVTCSRICVAENCNSVGIRYGKYCGVGWTGCPGEKPCDDLDACCKIHDDCVGKKGMTDIKCHEKFKTCIKKVQKSGKVGFSQQCPYETAVPTMVQEHSFKAFSDFSKNSIAERLYWVFFIKIVWPYRYNCFRFGDDKIHQSTEGMNSYGNAAVIFDDSGSDDDNYITCFVSSTLVQETYNDKGITKLYKERSTRTSITYITSDDDSSANELSPANDDIEAEEDVPRQISPSIAHLISKFSRRTKSVSSNPVRS